MIRFGRSWVLVAVLGAASGGGAWGKGAATALSLGGFVENAGQWAGDVRFGCRTSFGEVWVREPGFVLVGSGEARGWRIEVHHGRGEPVAEGGSGVTHSWFGAGARVVGLPVHDAVRQRGVEDGLDVVLRASGGTVRFDLELAPGRDAADVVFGVEGVDRMTVDEDGSLVLSRGGERVRLSAPVAWATRDDGSRAAVESSFEVLDSSFRLRAERRNDAPVVVDPTVVWTAGATPGGFATVTDAAAGGTALYLAGTFVSPAPFAASAGAADGVAGPAASDEVFVARLDAATGALRWVTFLGGSADELLPRVAIAPDGDVVVAGITSSTDFPVTAGAFDPVKSGPDDAFVARLDPTGQVLRFATYLGGSHREAPSTLIDRLVDVDVDASDVIHLVGHTVSTDFPVTSGAFATALAGGSDGWIARLDGTGSTLLSGTYVGGPLADGFGDVAALPDGSTLALGFGAAGVPGVPPGEKDRLVLIRVPPSGTGVAFGAAPAGVSNGSIGKTPVRLGADGVGHATLTTSGGFATIAASWRYDADTVVPVDGLGMPLDVAASWSADDGTSMIVGTTTIGSGIPMNPHARRTVGASAYAFETADLGAAAGFTRAAALLDARTLFVVTDRHPTTGSLGPFVTRVEWCAGRSVQISASCQPSSLPIPLLTFSVGCHEPGGMLGVGAFDDDLDPPGSAFLFVGAGAGVIPLTASCVLDMATVVPVAVPMVETSHGHVLEGTLPANLPVPFTFRGQAVLPHPGTPDGWAVSGGFEATIDV